MISKPPFYTLYSKGEILLKVAEVGQTIKSNKGIIGEVNKVYENSVIIKIIENPTDVSYDNMTTVINHKNYIILKETKI